MNGFEQHSVKVILNINGYIHGVMIHLYQVRIYQSISNYTSLYLYELIIGHHGNFQCINWHPTNVYDHLKGGSDWGVHDLIGNGWEWTHTIAPKTTKYSGNFNSLLQF